VSKRPKLTVSVKRAIRAAEKAAGTLSFPCVDQCRTYRQALLALIPQCGSDSVCYTQSGTAPVPPQST
jgi:hypothetical protein